MEVDAGALTNHLAKQLLGRVVAVNEAEVLEVGDVELLVRIRCLSAIARKSNTYKHP